MDFFAPRKRSNRIDLTASKEEETTPAKKKYANHVKTNNFSQTNIDERVTKLAGTRTTKHAWRRVQNVIEIPYTIVIQTFEFEGRSFERKHFCPWGMHRMVEEKMKAIQVKNSFSSLPNDVKEELGITKDNFVRENVKVTASNTGFHAKDVFVRLFCSHCQDSFWPKLLNNPKYGNCKSIEEFIHSWDELKVPKMLCGVVGCFIYSKDPEVHAGPNAKTFIKEPTEHYTTFHPELGIKELSSKQLKFKQDIQLLLSSGSSSSASKAPPLTTVKPTTSDASSASLQNLPNQTHLVGKYSQRTVYTSIESKLDKKLKTNDPCDTPLQKVAKGFCFSMVHTGVNKRQSEAVVIEQYKVAYRGIFEHYSVEQADLEDRYTGVQSDISIVKPQECCLDANNIVKYERSILSAYQSDPDGLYQMVAKKCQFWSIMHDGIMKFDTEYNGMFITSLNPDTFKQVLLPFRLMKMKAGVDAHALVDSLFTAFSEFIELKNSAFVSIPGALNFEICSPPTFFKLGTLLSHLLSETEIHIQMSDRLPVANVGDGVGVNVKAARVASELYGLLTPDLRCFVHSVDGCWKRMAKSETMCVEAVKTLYNNLKTVVKHFKFSGKSKELLDESIKVLEMTKGVHLMTWCATRMAHFLVACERFNSLLVPVYNTMYTQNIKAEERDALFHVDNIFTMKVVSDVHGVMHNKLLRAGDKTDCLVSTAYASALDTSKKIESIELKNAVAFRDSLSIDSNGNLMFEEQVFENSHSLRLANSHHPRRGETEDERLAKIRDSLETIQNDILKNIKDNLRDQIGDDTYFYNWSGIDMSDKSLDLEQRLNRLDPLFRIFTDSDRVHVVQTYRTTKEKGDDTVPFKWCDRSIHLHYSSPISCSNKELVEEFKAAWPFVCRSWLSFKDKKNQREFFESLLAGADTGVRFPYFCNFIMILLSPPANTSPLERSYSGLEMICTPRRNHISADHLECLYLLSTLQLPVKSSMDYKRETEILMNM